MPERRRISTGGPWESSHSYSRALVVGDRCLISGTTDAGPDGRSRHPDDAGAQARAVFELMDGVLERAGFSRSDVVRTRMFVVRPEDAPAVGAAHGGWFRGIDPVATLVLVAGLVDPSLLVEIEAEAMRGS